MSAVPVVISDPIDADAELAQLAEMTTEDLRLALSGGILGRGTCTENDPPYLPGGVFHGVTTRSLREQLLPRGWTKDDSGGYSKTISPDRSIAIVVATGDEWTGRQDERDPGRQPKTTRPKGPLTAAVIEENERQYELLEGMLSISPASRMQTWVLLIHYSGDGSASAELSLPRELDSESRIATWRKRIIIRAVEGDGPDLALRGMPEPGPEFDIDIVPRAS